MYVAVVADAAHLTSAQTQLGRRLVSKNGRADVVKKNE